MTNTAKTLTFVIPAYNMESYLDRCVNSLLSASDTRDLEVLIVDDGSKDGTLEYARKLERTNPGAVRAIHQENKGHGGAVNTGIAAATGMYVKVVDADDWVDPQAIDTVLATLRAQHDTDEPIDMLVTNYVYDKVAKRHKTVVNFRHVMETGRVLGWDDLGKFGLAQYIIMHALTFRTQVVRDSGLQLPEHTFYVDFYYSYQPFPWVKRIQYLDVPFYHYFIGREGQSVQTDVMIRRVDQLRLVNRLMTEATPERGTVPEGLYRYMIHFLAIESCVTSAFLILSRDPANYVKKTELWDAIDAYSPAIGKDVRAKLMSRALNLPGKPAHTLGIALDEPVRLIPVRVGHNGDQAVRPIQVASGDFGRGVTQVGRRIVDVCVERRSSSERAGTERHPHHRAIGSRHIRTNLNRHHMAGAVHTNRTVTVARFRRTGRTIRVVWRAFEV